MAPKEKKPHHGQAVAQALNVGLHGIAQVSRPASMFGPSGSAALFQDQQVAYIGLEVSREHVPLVQLAELYAVPLRDGVH